MTRSLGSNAQTPGRLRIAGYEISQLLFEGRSTVVYRARREADGQPVILKALSQPQPPPSVLARLQREYELLRSLALPGVVAVYGLEKHDRTWVMFLEDFGGTSLQRLLAQGPLPVAEVLAIALAVSETLAAIHERGIIHKDLTPGNIAYNPATGQVKVIDFGISTRLVQESPEFSNVQAAEGTLAYIAPEQTGRMNRHVDYRSDFYTLGATLYHLVTGQPPFTETDPLALIHCHIARRPLAPHLRSDLPEGVVVPEGLSDIVIKLLSKDVEARYQSAAGLHADLAHAAAAWRERRAIPHFDLGRRDRSLHFHVPQRLYAREIELGQLLSAFARVAGGAAETLFVSGPPGIGKSMLVQEVYRPVTERRGYFAAGKFDQLQRNVPYAPLLEAFRKLLRELLGESEAVLAEWRKRFAQALGPNGALMEEVIPELAHLLEVPPPVPELPPAEAQNRFLLVLLHFVRAFAGPEHPLVVFLDDLQWADGASLEFIERLMTASDTGHVFFIGAYRDDSAREAHPVAHLREAILKAGAHVEETHLGPLGPVPLSQLVADALGTSVKEATPLAHLLHDKTGGNPFFVGALLEELYRGRLLQYDAPRGLWTWDLQKIAGLALTDNVVELVLGRARHLTPAAQEVLERAACIGNHFDLATLVAVDERTARETARDLGECVAAGLVLPLGEACQWVQWMATAAEREAPGLAGTSQGAGPAELSEAHYRFAHDRIQQAAYALIDESERPAMHHRIGQRLLGSTPAEERPRRIFDLVHQLNLALPRLTEAAEREALAELNLLAARRAKDAAAYGAALGYARVALGLLPDDAWERRYDLMLPLHEAAVEGALLSADYEAMDAYAAQAIARARDVLDVKRIYDVKIQALTLRERHLEALEVALGLLRALGVPLAPDPGVPRILLELLKVRWALRGRRIEDLADLDRLDDPRQQAAIRVLMSAITPAVFARPKLVALLVAKALLLSVRSGNGPEASLAYTAWAAIRIGFMNDIVGGYRFGQLATRVQQRYGAPTAEPQYLFNLHLLIRPWKEPLRDCLNPLVQALQRSLELGNHEYAAHFARFYCQYLFVAGEDLGRVEREMERHGRLLADLKQPLTLRSHGMWQQLVLNLMGRSEDPLMLVGVAHDERVVLPELVAAKSGHTLCDYHLHKLFLALLFGDVAAAVAHADEADALLQSQVSSFMVSLVTFYGALARLLAVATAQGGTRRRLHRRVKAASRRLGQLAEHAPMNFRHRHLLVAAETERLRGPWESARKLYDQAIENAREHGWIQDEALGCELAGRACLEVEDTRLAKLYLQDAHYAYHRWGALAKAKALADRYPEFQLRTGSEGGEHLITARVIDTVTTGKRAGGRAVDLESVMRAAQALVSETERGPILMTLMRIVIENAGAERGWLLLPRGGGWVIAATGEVGDTGHAAARTFDEQETLVTAQDLPLTLIHAVARTQESLVLDDAATRGLYARDPYVYERQPRSVLCAPLGPAGQLGSLAGVVYLENNLTAGAFTAERLQMIDLLLSQATVSLRRIRESRISRRVL
ncbi:MAG TPA: AAA family ATPase [Polyangia bacterium]|nr:AAA family ATPase [Polyangia bacterium]